MSQTASISDHRGADINLCAVRWYVRYALSYRDVEELLRERGVGVDHTAGVCWVQRDAPELDRRCRPFLRATNDSYRVNETYIKGYVRDTCKNRSQRWLAGKASIFAALNQRDPQRCHPQSCMFSF